MFKIYLDVCEFFLHIKYLPVIFQVVHFFESFATNITIEKGLIFIFAMISFVNQQIVLFVERSGTYFAVVGFNNSSRFFSAKMPGFRWIWMYSKHCSNLKIGDMFLVNKIKLNFQKF